jgi:Uncharacterized protein conserved in bacteria (DUF2147)
MHPQRQRRCHNRYGADSGDVARSYRSRLKQIGCAALVLIGLVVFVPRTVASAGIPEGVWLIDNEAAVQIFDCRNLLCGRILWLSIPRDPQSRLDRDKKNPELALRQRPLCGLTILWGLRPTGPDRWTDGWFYNPDDGGYIQYLSGTQIRRHDRRTHLSGRPAPWEDQNSTPRATWHIKRMVLNEGWRNRNSQSRPAGSSTAMFWSL